MAEYDRWTNDRIICAAKYWGCEPYDLVASTGMFERRRASECFRKNRWPPEVGILIDKLIRFKLGLHTPDEHIKSVVAALNMEPINGQPEDTGSLRIG